MQEKKQDSDKSCLGRRRRSKARGTLRRTRTGTNILQQTVARAPSRTMHPPHQRMCTLSVT